MEILILIIAIIIGIFIFKITKKNQSKKGASKLIVWLYSLGASSLAFIIIIIIAGSTIFKDTTKISENEKLEVLSVSDFSYKMKDKQSVSINFGKTIEEYYTITIFRDDIKSGVDLIKNKENYIDNINAEAIIGNAHYVFINKDGFDSFIKFKILDIDNNNKIVKLNVSMKLYDATNNNIKELNNYEFSITGNMFDNLIKNIE